MQESPHPNHWGHLALRNCLRLAYNNGAPLTGRCTNSGGLNAAGEPNMTLTKQVSVPDVVGLQYPEASSRISAAGLSPRKAYYQTCDFFESDEVVDQRPGPGGLRDLGDTVTLLVMRLGDTCNDL